MLLVNRVHVRVCSLPFLAHCEEQKVNPKLTLPYWDFTIEEQDAELSFNDNLKIDSPLFQESWFGSSDPEDNVVSSLFLPPSLSLSLSFWTTEELVSCQRRAFRENDGLHPSRVCSVSDRYVGVSTDFVASGVVKHGGSNTWPMRTSPRVYLWRVVAVKHRRRRDLIFRVGGNALGMRALKLAVA